MQGFRYFKPWINPLFSLFLVFLIGSIGYKLTEGWNWADCIWMVLITISTIGFGEVHPLTQEGRIVTFLVITGGFFVVQLSLQKLFTLSNSGYFIRIQDLRLKRVIRKMKNHIIICGYGRLGCEIASQLNNLGIETIIIENDITAKNKAEKDGFNVLFGDATHDSTLINAGLINCKSVIVALPNDASNLYVILSSKGINSSCKIIAKGENHEASKKLKLAGADVVISPYIAAGKTMAQASID